MKNGVNILIKNNDAFGGYIGKLVDNDFCTIELPSPFNVKAKTYTGDNLEKIINHCKEDALNILNTENVNVIDLRLGVE